MRRAYNISPTEWIGEFTIDRFRADSRSESPRAWLSYVNVIVTWTLNLGLSRMTRRCRVTKEVNIANIMGKRRVAGLCMALFTGLIWSSVGLAGGPSSEKASVAPAA